MAISPNDILEYLGIKYKKQLIIHENFSEDPVHVRWKRPLRSWLPRISGWFSPLLVTPQ